MKIIIVGVSCVGKSTGGKILADKIGYKFFDFDFEVEKYFRSHITFLKREYPFERTYREKVSVVLSKILKENNVILAMPPSGLMDNYWRIIKKDDSLITIALRDKAKNILERITFYDDYSNPMESPVTKENEKYYLNDIRLDMEYFGRSYRKAKIRKDIDGRSAFQVAYELKDLLFAEERQRDFLN
jgi:shikimate kinase